ncbi:PEP-CTERM sorting domain-containing protein [Rhodoferax sp. U11-2br]|uniref:PEP-CTERM sorting domain-containing protein n=1 Tax=Rhodoferax sp. U11-2br TaxID=2838878 RepID=UPI002036B82F|nr:PEP-CTERM sorting domain-containing protein [Rhodoferax sp. U11-2br]
MSNNLIRSILLAVTLAGASVASQATPVTVTFNEAGAPGLGVLDGTTFYQSYGIANFTTAIRFGADPRLPDDGFGITNNGSSGSVIFGEDISALGMTWAVSGQGVTFVAELYDAADLLLETFSSGGVGLFGNASFAASNVRKVVFHDGGTQVAIDTLTYTRGTVPEPATLALVGLALAGAAVARRRKA